MSRIRKIQKLLKSQPTIEGAGVLLKRAFGFSEPHLFDPFLLLDDFRSDKPEDYIKGFPWHPHRGIETITYVLQGDVEHSDSLGNSGIISSGDVQWMTAGSGIIHHEMPKGDLNGRMAGFQLWANLPASEKMMPPRYRDLLSTQIPEVVLENGTKIKIICGRLGETQGPVTDIIIDPEYLDITVPARESYSHLTEKGYTVFAYVVEGTGVFGPGKTRNKGESENFDELQSTVGNENLILFEDGDEVMVTTGNMPVRFLLISGKPLHEPIAWQGPIVMNTQEELRIAFEEYNNGTFIKDSFQKFNRP
ncbi:MAG: pirin family protein [Deltaproteobacteria bacterium]|nr:pirin family protein [Deltaproteobacteria bacterium]